MSKKFKFKSEKPKEKWRIFNCSDIGEDARRAKGPHIELFGNREMTVEGCIGVYEYNDSYLKLKLPKGALIVCGSNFDIAAFEGSTITIRGNMSSVEFCV
ncbi:MAG: YabP/YqfC family sporulation protein [Acutalibacteraceae bacterium]